MAENRLVPEGYEPYTLTEEDFVNSPSLEDNGLKPGDVIYLGPILTEEELDQLGLNDEEQTESL
jgi:hypothetical protein